tara:strand:+ start:150 stop:470 length:321 start_codon:yes stop_codon:yes gene_type:complete
MYSQYNLWLKFKNERLQLSEKEPTILQGDNDTAKATLHRFKSQRKYSPCLWGMVNKKDINEIKYQLLRHRTQASIFQEFNQWIDNLDNKTKYQNDQSQQASFSMSC